MYAKTQTKMTDGEVIAAMREALKGQGTEKIVRLNFSQYGNFFNEDFVQSCVSEVEKVCVRAAMGETPTPLERLAYHLLKESAHIDA